MKKLLTVLAMSVSILFANNANAEILLDKAEVNGLDKKQMIIINKNVNELAFFENGQFVKKYKVATGRTAVLTPEGDFQIANKVIDMPYYKTNIPGGDPRNPLGDRWIGLTVPGTAGFTYGIHGNNAAWSIGTNASSGCVRMHNEEVRELFKKVEDQAFVTIVRSDKDFHEIYKEKEPKLKELYEKRQIEKSIENAKLKKEILQKKSSSIDSESKTETIVYERVKPDKFSVHTLLYWFETKLNFL